MRIISGMYRGRRIDLPKNLKLRPTTDMAKESLFNILNNLIDFDEVEALDLFSGTGSIGYEMVSRGALNVLAVEQETPHVKFIESIIAKMEFENMRVLRMDVFRFLATNKKQFDLIFADPPYDMLDFEKFPERLFSTDLLKSKGVFVIEHSKKYSFANHPHFFDHRNYGSVNFSFFRRENT